MGTDIHWRSKPNAHDHTWFSMNVSGVMFYRGALSPFAIEQYEAFLDATYKRPKPDAPRILGTAFPYDIENTPGLIEDYISRLRDLLKRPNEDPHMTGWANGQLDKSYTWREAMQSLLDYLIQARDKGGGIIAS